ncbi:MAG: RNA-binding domain-containing protein [Terriglobales bacterium]
MRPATAPKPESSLAKALAAKRESKSIEFKEEFDIQSKQHWCEVLKDIVALANSGGGTILFGVDDAGAATGADVAPVATLDPAAIADKINSYTGTNFADFQVGQVQKGRALLAFVTVEAAAIPLVFTRPGTYGLADGKQGNAFAKGSVYFRHGAKSEPGTTDDLRRSFDRQLRAVRNEWMRGVRKVVKAPAGAKVVLLPAEVRQSTAPGATRIQIVNDASAPAYRLVDPDEQYPYRQKELIAAVQKALAPGQLINGFDVLCIRKIHKIDDDKNFFYRPKFGSPQYSREFADWITDNLGRDKLFLEQTRTRFIRTEVGGWPSGEQSPRFQQKSRGCPILTSRCSTLVRKPGGRHLCEPSAGALGRGFGKRISPEGGTFGKNLRGIGPDAVFP